MQKSQRVTIVIRRFRICLQMVDKTTNIFWAIQIDRSI